MMADIPDIEEQLGPVYQEPPYRDIFNYLTSDTFPPAFDQLPTSHARCNARRNLKKQSKRYRLSDDRTDLLVYRKVNRRPGKHML